MSAILIVGSGIAGMQAAADLAKSGHTVFLIEKDDELGGNLKNRSEVFPSHEDASEVLSVYLNNINNSKNITVMKQTEILDFDGEFPKFQVSLKSPGGTKDLTVNAVILATGFREYDPTPLKHYGYGKFKDVITTAELEKMLKDGRLLRPSNLKEPKAVVFVQCAGSRDCQANAYCSDFCCNNSIKLATQIKREHADIAVSLFYIDIRTPYDGELEFRNARLIGIRFFRGKPARIKAGDESLTIDVEDTLENDLVFVKSDLLVLSAGVIPDPTVSSLSQKMNVDLSESGFFAVDEATAESNIKGIYVVGGASGPKDTAHSMIQGSCAAVKIHSLTCFS